MAVFDPDLQPSSDRGHLLTEQSNQRSSRLDQLDTLALVELFADEDRRPQEAVAAVAPALAQAVDSVAERLRAGGRLFYLGAGTSGRLGVLDAAECPPTFCSDPQQVQGVLAGGSAALLRSSEGLEDIEAAGRADLEERGFCAKDCLVGIAAGGTTPTCAVGWRSPKASEPSPSPWPAFQRSRRPCPATSTSACSRALSC